MTSGAPRGPGEPGTRTIEVDYLARVEGEGALTLRMRGSVVEEVAFRIFEPPRFFEAFLRGRGQEEVPDITARICGICPVAYQMSSCHAIEDALGVVVGGPLRELRRLLYCGEWIESHVLHAFMLHAPDFLGYHDALAMAKDHPAEVKLALAIKKTGNAIVRAVGGREIHPINVRLGGFYRAPRRADLLALVPDLEKGRDGMAAALRWMKDLPFPDLSRDYELVSLRHPDEYPMNEGRLVSTRGLDIALREYPDWFEESHVARSNALHSSIRGRGAYLCGPLARFVLNFDKLPPEAQALAHEVGISPATRNPFRSLLVRGIETWYAFDEALRIIDGYREEPRPSFVPVPTVGRGTGHGCTEAPRGILYHRYTVADGKVEAATIIPPTSQNQKSIEEDLVALAPSLAAMPLEEATWRAEQAIRNYDPCISCATHFLKLEIEQVGEVPEGEGP